MLQNNFITSSLFISGNNIVVTYSNFRNVFTTNGDVLNISYTSSTIFPGPSPPILTCSYLASNLMTVSWTPIVGTTGYSFMLNGSAVIPSNATNSSATFTNLTAATNYSLVLTIQVPSGPLSSSALVVTTSAVNASFPNTATATAVSKAVPTTIRYKKIVCWGLAPQAVNFAQATTLGHRVAITLPVDLMNLFFTWSRASQEVAPTGRFTNNPVGTVAGQTDFVSELVKAFGKEYNDLDGVASGLNFSSSALDMAGDLKRDPCVYNVQTDTGSSAAPKGVSTTHYGANDLVMAYLMFKCFGSSSYDPTDIIYNVDDAFNMLSSQQLAEVINASLEAEDALANAAVLPNGKPVSQQLAGDNKGQVDAMFRGFLASDPLRYFLNGVQIPGLFETNFVCPPSDPSVGGNWCLTVGDKIEVPLQLVFRAPVTIMSVQDNVQNPSSATPDSTTTTIIGGETATFDCTAQKAALANVVPIRLQISCGSPSVGTNTGATSAVGQVVPLTVVPSSSIIFYTPMDYGVQTANPIAVAGGTGAYAYSMTIPIGEGCPTLADGFTIDPLTGILSFTPNFVPSLIQPLPAFVWGKHVVKISVTDHSSPVQNQIVYVNVSFDDGEGASNNSVFMGAQTYSAGQTTNNGTVFNPLYDFIDSGGGTFMNGKTLVYASPPYACSGSVNGSVPILTGPLSFDIIYFGYSAPAVNSLGPNSPAVRATSVTWSITSQSGRSGPGALPAGISFTPGSLTSRAAYLMINLDPSYTPPSAGIPSVITATVGADYTPGNTAGNVPGDYKFLITATDNNGYVQSFNVNIKIALPPPMSAPTPLGASGTAGLAYVNGNTLTYSKAAAVVDTITLVDTMTAANYKWSMTPATSLALGAADLVFTGGSPTVDKATLVVTSSAATIGSYPYLISALDSNNVVQTIFFTLNIVA